MKNTARVYSSTGALRTSRENGAPPAYEAVTPSRPGSIKKQKQLQKSKESLMAKQTELSTLVGKLEDRDTQQQAFTALLELLPRLDNALVADLYTRVEKNKNPGRSSTRRMFVLVLAAMAKCHPLPTARLLPRVLAYISLRLRDKEVQITDACTILCSAITLYVIPHAGVNSKGNLSPKKKQVTGAGDDPDDPTVISTSPADDPNFQTFEHLVNHLSRETNAVGEHATKCIASILRPVEFDGTSTPPPDVVGPHGKRVSGFLRVLMQSLVSKMNESTQYAGFSSTFLLLQAVVALAKLLALDSLNRDVLNIVLPHLGSLIDAIEDVFREGPREDWVVRKRGIELLIQLLDLFACGETSSNDSGRAFFDKNLERIRRLVTEARHDPVSAVRDAALPAVFLFDKLAKMFPRRGEPTAPPSPFKRVYSARGSGVGGSGMKTFMGASTGSLGSRPRNTIDEKLTDNGARSENETDQEVTFEESRGDECASPHEDLPTEDAKEDDKPLVPPLKLTSTATFNKSSSVHKDIQPIKSQTIHKKAKGSRIRIPRIAAPRSPPVERVSVPFQPPNEDEDAFPETFGDEHIAESVQNDDDTQDAQSTKQAVVIPTENAQERDESDDLPPMTRAEAAIVAAAEGEIDLALRLAFLEDDMTLLRRVLTLSIDPCTSSLSRASRTALCAAFLEFLDVGDDANDENDDMWIAFTWLRDLSLQPRFVQQLDPRVLRALELRLNLIAEQPSRAGLVAADILTSMHL